LQAVNVDIDFSVVAKVEPRRHQLPPEEWPMGGGASRWFISRRMIPAPLAQRRVLGGTVCRIALDWHRRHPTSVLELYGGARIISTRCSTSLA
jgi:hypothetical protein